MFSMSKANDAKAKTAKKESLMSFHKVAPVKKTRKPAAPAPAPKKKAAKKVTPKRRPVGHRN